MAITVQDIHATADRIAAEGQQPTLAAVRSALGGGSFSTISDGMKSWKLAQKSVLIREPAPADIIERMTGFAAEVWSLAQCLANERFLAERQALAESRCEMEQIQREAVCLADQLASEIEQQKLRIEKYQVQADQNMTMAQDLAVAETALIEVRKRADELAELFNQERTARIESDERRGIAEQSVASLTSRLEAEKSALASADLHIKDLQSRLTKAEDSLEISRAAGKKNSRYKGSIE
jgi:hypothetical protein